MNALAHGTPNALATATANACGQASVRAKRREEKRKVREGKAEVRGREVTTRVAGSSISFSNPTRAICVAWMTGADAPQGWAA